MQIGVSIGDIKRIVEHTGRDTKDIIRDSITLSPYEEDGITKHELGLVLPCTFRKDDKCSIYPARPQNCRLFPYWIIARVPGWEVILADDYPCVKGFDPDEEEMKKIFDYAKENGLSLQEEIERTDALLDRIIVDGKIDVDALAYEVDRF